MSRDRKTKRDQHRRTAFSLIEVLAVVFIIALLIAILFPSLLRARQAARNLACASHLRAFGNALTFYKTGAGCYPKVNGPPRDSGLTQISGEVAKLLVRQSLGDPRALYCPVSLHDDPEAKPSSKLVLDGSGNSTYQYYWMAGQTSYAYLSGINYLYPDLDGNPTFNPDRESPDGPRNTRAVLVGDRTVRLAAPAKIVGSNHGDRGGWFYFVAGDVAWRDLKTLVGHPTTRYTWFWPRTAAPPPKPVAGN